MIRAVSLAIGQLDDPRLRRYLWISVGAALGVMVALWVAVGWLLHSTRIFDWIWLDGAIDLLGGLGTLVLSWLLFPGVIGAVLGLLLENVAGAVEARHYPNLSPAPGTPPLKAAGAAARFLAVTIGLNLLVLFVLFVPPLFPFVFYAVNGYLLSREYFEVVALRRLPPEAAEDLRRRHRGTLFVLGVGVAFVLTVPVVNLIAPVVATAALVHLFEGWRRT